MPHAEAIRKRSTSFSSCIKCVSIAERRWGVPAGPRLRPSIARRSAWCGNGRSAGRPKGGACLRCTHSDRRCQLSAPCQVRAYRPTSHNEMPPWGGRHPKRHLEDAAGASLLASLVLARCGWMPHNLAVSAFGLPPLLWKSVRRGFRGR